MNPIIQQYLQRQGLSIGPTQSTFCLELDLVMTSSLANVSLVRLSQGQWERTWHGEYVAAQSDNQSTIRFDVFLNEILKSELQSMKSNIGKILRECNFNFYLSKNCPVFHGLIILALFAIFSVSDVQKYILEL